MSFTQKSIDFLVENHLQNSRLWFNEHKADYSEYVLKPMQELVTALTPGMLKIDSEFITEPKVDKTISRIYRDTRFSKDKSLYRNNCWLTFMREKKLYMGMPAFWFEINPTGFGYGMGYYLASPQTMASIRKMICEDDELFGTAWAEFKKQAKFTLEGELYKKTKYPDKPEDLRNILDRKSISFNRYSPDFSSLFSDCLADELIRDYRLLAPMYDFFCAAEMRK